MNKKSFGIICSAALLLTCAIVSHGRVFERTSVIANSTKVLLANGGTVAYESSVSINGGRGDLVIAGFTKAIDQVVRELGLAFNAGEIVYSGGSMGFITVKADGSVLKMTVISLGKDALTLVFKIHQSEAEFQASSRPPAEIMLNNIPFFPGSDAVFHARDDKSNAGIAVSRTTSDPDTVLNYYKSQMISAGWTPSIPARSSARDSNMQVYNRGREICCVLVDISEEIGKNRITLLHKQPGIE